MCASLLSVITLLAVLSSAASQDPNAGKMAAGNLHLQDLALPPEVITEALFNQVDATQDELEQCEEMVRNLLRDDPTQETSDVGEHSQDIAQKAVDSFAQERSASDNSQNLRSQEKTELEREDSAEESEEKSRDDSLDNDDKNSETENNSDDSDSQEEEEEDDEEVGASDRPSSSSVSPRSSAVWTQDTARDESTSPQTDETSSTTQTTVPPGDERYPTSGVFERRRKRSSTVQRAVKDEEEADVIINPHRKTHGAVAADERKLSGPSQALMLSQANKEAGPARTMTKLQLLSLSRVGAEPQHSDRVRAVQRLAADPAQTPPADDVTRAAFQPREAGVSSKEQNPPPVSKISRSPSAKSRQPVVDGGSPSHRLSRRSVSGFLGNHDPTRFVPLIGQLVDRLTYLKRSLDVCRTLLKSGVFGTR